MDEFTQLKEKVAHLEKIINEFYRPDRYLFPRMVEIPTQQQLKVGIGTISQKEAEYLAIDPVVSGQFLQFGYGTNWDTMTFNADQPMPFNVGSYTFEINDGYVNLENQGGDPSSGVTGNLAVVGGKLKIYNGSAWVVVGTQS